MSLFGPYWFQDSSIPPNIENDSNGVQLSLRFNTYFDRFVTSSGGKSALLDSNPINLIHLD
ncbi:hypothetical protein C8J55DRAFT_566567 [Lentinula edodes]|uniref:Uncharacterized protein n=1 Tax=Lentinula lateritia TaxID=40482 RepID=A0A9W8ZST2_9AGAR|nr:hypothetical protein C8J55DRAFT_566567 [Lentinula edodes]